MADTEKKAPQGFKNVHNDEAVKKWGYRHQQCFILFWVLTVAYTMRACMGVSLVAMVTYDKVYNTSQEYSTMKLKQGFLGGLMLVPPYPIFHWNKKIQDTIIASFFWGYMLLQIPAGQLVHKFGAKYLLMGAMTVNCIVSILYPIATYYGGWYCSVICRFVQGLTQACIIPSLHTSLGKWAPLHERGRLCAFVHGGAALGTVFGLPLTGFISASPLGWPGIFRFYGVLSGLMALLIWFLVYDTASEHPKISDAERQYIEDALGTNEDKKKMSVPWLKILRHKGVYAIILAHVGSTWGTLILHSEVPAYMDRIMKVNIKANSLLTALPFLMMWFSNFFFSWFTDWLIVHNKMSVINTRKLANSLGFVFPGIGLIILAYAPRNIYFVETVLVIICIFKTSAYCGFMVNHIDITPNFAGTLMSLSNFVSNIGSSLAPIVTGFILTDVSDKYLWRYVFFVAAGLYLVTNLMYFIFGTTDKAEWNDPPQDSQEDEENVPMIDKPKTNLEK